MIASPQLRRRGGLALVGLGLLHGSCQGAMEPTNQFRLYTRQSFLQEGGLTTFHVLDTPSTRFSFAAPLRWAVKENPARKEVVMMARSLITSIRFKIVEAAPEATQEESKVQSPKSEVQGPKPATVRNRKASDLAPGILEFHKAQWRQSIQENYPDGKITAEFPCYTGRIEGAALDLERIAANKSKVFTRLAFIPLPDGRVEFDLTTTSANLAETRLTFGNFLTSFRVEPLASK